MSKFVNRSQIIKLAFKSHERNEFALSIPVFLSQADGIHYDILKKYMFITSDLEKIKRKILIELRNKGLRIEVSTSISYLLLEPLFVPNSILCSFSHSILENNGIAQDNLLNRHNILHGRDVNYATEINSLRAISLLEFLCQMETILK